jgi:hypothetical protein
VESSVEPLSTTAQVVVRLPVALIAFAGALVALALIRRLGVLSGLLAAGASLLLAIDQAANAVWVWHLRSISSDEDLNIDTFNTVNNAYLFADVVLITIAAALLVASFAVRRPAAPPAPPGTVAPHP